MEASVTRTSAGQDVQNTLIVPTFPLRFQIAPGRQSRLGIADAPFTVTSSSGEVIAQGVTDASGEVPIPLINLFFGSVTVHIFDTDYDVVFQPAVPPTTLQGQQKLLDVLGYETGYQLNFPPKIPPDDNIDGPRTEQAIMNFQCDERLAIDGKIGPKTLSKLKEATS
jgi:hypothetical protein